MDIQVNTIEFWTLIVGIIGGIAAIIGAITGLINLFLRIKEGREKCSVILELHPQRKSAIVVKVINNGTFTVHIQELFLVCPQTGASMKISFGAKSVGSGITERGIKFSTGLVSITSFPLDRRQSRQSEIGIATVAEKLSLSSGGTYKISARGSLQSGKAIHSKPLLISVPQQLQA